MKKMVYIRKRIEEFKISKKTHGLIRHLLQRCFSEYPEGRSYYQQVPSFRYLVYHGKQLVGHMAVVHRAINISGAVVPIFGIGDFCVDPEFQNQSIASDLLKRIEQQAAKHGIEFIILVANEHGIYTKNGYHLIDNPCRWLMITGQQTLGVGQRRIEKSILVKPIGERKWTPGLLDFLGPMF